MCLHKGKYLYFVWTIAFSFIYCRKNFTSVGARLRGHNKGLSKGVTWCWRVHKYFTLYGLQLAPFSSWSHKVWNIYEPSNIRPPPLKDCFLKHFCGLSNEVILYGKFYFKCLTENIIKRLKRICNYWSIKLFLWQVQLQK